MISPLWTAALSRHWPVIGAVTVFLLFSVAHEGCFRPAAKHYQAALKQARAIGLTLDTGRSAPILPPRVFALVSDNSISAAAAQEEEGSGTLTAEFLNSVTQLTGKHGLDIITTEPIPSIQQKGSVQVRAHLKLRCTYTELISLLNDLGSGPLLYSVDRFTLTAQPPSDEAIVEMWLSRFVLKQTQGHG